MVWFDRDCHPKHYLPPHNHVGKSSRREEKKSAGRSVEWYIQILSPRQSHGKAQSHMVFHHNGCIGRVLSERGFKVQSETMVIRLCTPKLWNRYDQEPLSEQAHMDLLSWSPSHGWTSVFQPLEKRMSLPASIFSFWALLTAK